MIRGRIFGTPLWELDEWSADRGPRSTTRISDPQGTTAHYAGPSDWRQAGVDRSTPDRFAATTDHDRCPQIMRAHRDFHMDSRGWSFYAYSGSACPHQQAFIGRGRDVRTAAQGTTAGNNRSLAIQALGLGVTNGVEDPLTDGAKRAFIDLADYLGYPLRWGHRDWKSTSCPGAPTYAWRLAGFPRPTGGDWFDMATREDLRAELNAVFGKRFREGSLTLTEALGYHSNHGIPFLEKRLEALLSQPRLEMIAAAGVIKGAAGPIADAVVARLPISADGGGLAADDVQAAVEAGLRDVLGGLDDDG